MNITCATLITKNSELLIVHPTNASKYKSWSLPKGCVNENEEYVDAAVRELEEETSLKISSSLLKYVGLYDYQKNKKYALFLYRINKMPDIKELKCLSYIDNTEILEVDEFKIIGFNEIEKYLNPKQFLIIDNALSFIM